MSVDENIKQLKPKTMEFKQDFIFRGRVIARSIEEKFLSLGDQKYKVARDWNEVKFQVLEVYHSTSKVQNTAPDEVVLKVGKCALGYKLGSEYMVYS